MQIEAEGLNVLSSGDFSIEGQLANSEVLAKYRGQAVRLQSVLPEDLLRISVVSHPNIAKVLGVTISDRSLEPAVPMLVIEHVEGPSLSTEVRTELLDPNKLARVGLQIVYALRAIHGRSFVYNQLNPENVIVGPSEIKLYETHNMNPCEEYHTKLGGLRGFMPPEQQFSRINHQTNDLYALGAVLYFAATGQVPPPPGSVNGSDREIGEYAVRAYPTPCPNDLRLSLLIRGLLSAEASRRPTLDLAEKTLAATLALGGN